MYVSAVILPDSTVFETGGGSTTIHNGNHPVYSAQIFDPEDLGLDHGHLTPTVPRLYHSSAHPAPGRAGRDVRGQPRRRVRDADRDLHAALPAEGHAAARPSQPRRRRSTYNGSYSLRHHPGRGRCSSAVLVRPMAVTHSSDPAQRLIDLPFTTTCERAQVQRHQQQEHRATGLVHALRGRRRRRAVSREAGSTSADGVAVRAAVAPTAAIPAGPVGAHDLDERVTGQEQDGDPAERADLPEERRPLEGRGQPWRGTAWPRCTRRSRRARSRAAG